MILPDPSPTAGGCVRGEVERPIGAPAAGRGWKVRYVQTMALDMPGAERTERIERRQRRRLAPRILVARE